MQRKIFKITARTVFAVFIIMSVLLGTFNLIIPSDISCYKGESPGEYPLSEISFDEPLMAGRDDGTVLTVNGTARICGIIPLKTVSVSYYDKTSVYVGGFPFGIKFKTDGIVVVGFGDVETETGKTNPAYSAGIRENDVITKINGKEIDSAQALTDLVSSCEGRELTFTCKREGAEFTVSLKPALSKSNEYKTGMWIKDSGAGIGTVTYINPTDLSFGGLGHGICDGATGNVIPFTRGAAMGVKINGIEKGLPGTPGEIKGSLNSSKKGVVLSNTSCGVFGVFDKLPEEAGDIYPIGLRNDVKEGEATIITTLDESGRAEYTVEISAINVGSRSNKCFNVKVTDERLIEKTGGIIQGMSGSPIIQNGKLIGAVTHVLVNDPTKGYGIFAENMLDTARGAEKIKEAG